MPHEERMFGAAADRSIAVPRRQGASVLLTVLLETVLIAVLVMMPLMAADVLPAPSDAIGAFVTTAAPPPPPPPPVLRTPSAEPPPRSAANVSEAAPIEPPSEILPDPPIENHLEPGASLSGLNGVPGSFGMPGGQEVLRPPSPSADPPRPQRVGGNVLPPKKTKHVNPIYPAIALSSRIEDLVIIEATIDESGRVRDARVLRGNPLLNDAALEAVRQWEFTPTLLNGRPTTVIMSVTVNFRLH